MLVKISGVALAALVLMGPGFAQAQKVEQSIAHGQINWTDKTITVTGSGAPSLKAPNVAVARLNAERAAKMDALRNIVEAVKGVKVTGNRSAGEAMKAGTVQTKVEGIVRNFTVLDTKYYSDGGVDVIVQVNIDGVLTDALVPQTGDAVKKAPLKDITGVVVNAKGVDVTPAIAPEIIDEGGNRIYHPGAVERSAMLDHGAVSYNKSLEKAMKDSRVGSKPLVVRALKASDSSNLVISSADGAKLIGAGGALALGKVIIVTD